MLLIMELHDDKLPIYISNRLLNGKQRGVGNQPLVHHLKATDATLPPTRICIRVKDNICSNIGSEDESGVSSIAALLVVYL